MFNAIMSNAVQCNSVGWVGVEAVRSHLHYTPRWVGGASDGERVDTMMMMRK